MPELQSLSARSYPDGVYSSVRVGCAVAGKGLRDLVPAYVK
jgi:hypothetical protein